MTRYRIDRISLTGISRVDRETKYFWMQRKSLGDGRYYWLRSKKSWEDRVFDTFEEARADLMRRLAMRIAAAEALESDGWVADFNAEDSNV